jgi:hypothetical protein
MNKNKLVLVIILGLIGIFIVWIILNLNSDKTQTWNQTKSVAEFHIWLYNDWVEGMTDTLAKFKEKSIAYKSTQFKIETFNDYEDYTLALTSAFAQGKGPDMYEINNSEKNWVLFYNSDGIQPDIINPNDFRKTYNGVFSDDLIDVQEYTEDWEIQKVEYLRGIPVGFETLGIFYNKAKRIKASDFYSLSSLNTKIDDLKNSSPNTSPIAIWNGSTVKNSSEIIKQFFLLENAIVWLEDVTWAKMKSPLTSYMLFWDENWDNWYNENYSDMISLNKTWVDLFVRNETFMLVWYPRDLYDIDNKWFNKGLLAAEPFPFYNLAEGTTSIKYDYFVKNKNSENTELSDALFQYLTSDNWADEYLKNYSYYLPALLSLESDKIEDKIIDKYNITLWDFYNPDHLLQSFNVGVKNMFDREIIKVLDNTSNYIDAFNGLRTEIVCKSSKYTTLEGLSNSCE